MKVLINPMNSKSNLDNLDKYFSTKLINKIEESNLDGNNTDESKIDEYYQSQLYGENFVKDTKKSNNEDQYPHISIRKIIYPDLNNTYKEEISKERLERLYNVDLDNKEEYDLYKESFNIIIPEPDLSKEDMVVKYIIEFLQKDSLEQLLKHSSSNVNYTNIIKYLVKNNIDVMINDGMVLNNVVKRNNKELVEYLVSNIKDIHTKPNSAILEALKNSNKVILEYLVSNKFEFDAPSLLFLYNNKIFI